EAPSAATIGPVMRPNGRSGRVTSRTTCANVSRTLTEASKFWTTSGWLQSAAAFGIPILRRRAIWGRGPRGGSTRLRAARSRPAPSRAGTRAQALRGAQRGPAAAGGKTGEWQARRRLPPETAEGVRTEQAVAERMGNATRPAETAEPGPEEEPPLQ